MSTIAETTPKFWDVVFSLKCFVAAMLALWIGLMMDLPNPYWSVGAVYIVAHPLSGATTSKGIYRLIGTAIGGAVTIAMVPLLIESPELLTLAIGLWMAACLVVSLLDGTPRSYLFMLAGYTVAIAAFVVVTKPETTFDYAIGRVEEIAIGIICAAVINRLVFPRHTGPVLISRIDSWLHDGAKMLISTLRGNGAAPEVLKMRQKLAADTLELRNLTTHIAYDTSSLRNVGFLLSVLQQRMVTVLPIMSSLHDVLSQKSATSEKGWDREVRTLIDEVCVWLESGESLSNAQRARWLALIDDIELHNSDADNWDQLLPFNLTARVRDLVQIWSDCLTLRQDIMSGSRHSLRWRRYDTHKTVRPAHRDFVMALLSGLAVLISTYLSTTFWIATGWSQGGAAAMMAGIFCCIFATMDNPVPVMKKFGWLVVFVFALALVVQFALLPLVDGFVPLVLVLGLVLIPAGILLAIPAKFMLGMVICVNLPYMLMLQSRLSLDFVTFVNGNLATVFGIVIAAVVTSIVRSVSAEWSVNRLIKAGWKDIVSAAHKQTGRHRRERMNRLLQRMIDRIGMMSPRLALIPDSDMTKVDLLRDLRNGMSTIDLQRYRSKLSGDCGEAVDEVLAGTEAHYKAMVKNEPRDQIDASLLNSIDKAIKHIIEDGTPATAKRPRLALVSLRFNLFPGAQPFSMNQNPRNGQPINVTA